MKKKWSKEEEITLVGMAELGYTIRDIAAVLNRTVHSVQSRLTRYAFKKAFPNIQYQANNEYESPLGLESE